MMWNRGRTRRLFLFFLILVFLTVVPALQYYYGIIDPFLLKFVGADQALSKSVHVPLDSPNVYDGYPYQVPGAVIMVLSVSVVTGIEPANLTFLPLLLVPFVFCWLVLAKRLMPHKSRVFMLFSILIMVLSLGVTSTIYGVFPHSWAYVLFPLALAMFYDLLAVKDIRKSAIVIIFFMVATLYYYSLGIWLTVFFGAMLALTYGSAKSNARRISPAAVLTLLSAVFTLAFNRMIYTFSSLQDEPVFVAALGSFMRFIRQFSPAESSTKFGYAAPMEGTLIHASLALVLILPALACFAQSLAVVAKNRFKMKGSGSSAETRWSILVVAILIVAVVDVVIYSIAGTFAYRYLLFLSPLVTLSYLWKRNRRMAVKRLLTVAILALSVLGILASISYGTVQTSQHRYQEFDSSFSWISEKHPGQLRVLGDLPLIARYYLDSAVANSTFKRLYIDEATYESIVSPSDNSIELNESVDFVVLNMKFKIVQSGEWQQFAPYIGYSDEIHNNPSLSEVYDDGFVWVLIPSV